MAVLGIAAAEPAKWAGEEGDQEAFGIYPENALSVSVFLSMSSQWDWTGGMESQRCGLKHEVLPLHMDKVGVPRKRRFEIMADVQVMEHSALETWGKAAEERRRRTPSK